MTNKRDFTKIEYYPVSIEKLQKASMREAAYLIAPVNIGEDYEYFDEVKHLLDFSKSKKFGRKSIEEISQELDEKIDELIEKTKRNFYASKLTAERNYEYKFDKIFENFEYAKEHGQFPQKLKWVMGTGLSGGSYEQSFVIKQGNKHEGYYTIGNQRYLRYYMPDKPNAVVRFFMKTCLGFLWVDDEDAK